MSVSTVRTVCVRAAVCKTCCNDMRWKPPPQATEHTPTQVTCCTVAGPGSAVKDPAHLHLQG